MLALSMLMNRQYSSNSCVSSNVRRFRRVSAFICRLASLSVSSPRAHRARRCRYSSLHSSSYHRFCGMVRGGGVRPVCVVCGKELMAEVWRTEDMCDVRTESGVDGCRRHKPCSTSVE